MLDCFEIYGLGFRDWGLGMGCVLWARGRGIWRRAGRDSVGLRWKIIYVGTVDIL